MKFKYYIRGAGVGILFATIVLFISYSLRYNEAGIIREAKKLGMEMKTDNTGNFVNGDNTSGNNDTTNDNGTGPDDGSTSGSDVVNNDGTTEADTTPGEDTKSDMVTFSIEKGMHSGEIAKMLEELGLIDDWYDFDSYICDSGYAARMKVGTYEVSRGISKEMLLQTIIG